MLPDLKKEVANTPEQIVGLVDCIVCHHAPAIAESLTMYIDLEGVNLCREGSVSIVTLLIDTGTTTRRVYLIDVHTLGERAFNSAGAKGKTLKDILQDETIRKVFFDVRNGSDALFAHFGVALQGIEDVQLMESATRKTTTSRRLLNGLARCVEENVLMSSGRSELASWKLAKDKGARLFQKEHGGSYEVFNQRPIPKDIISYCVGDVQYLPELRRRFWTQQTSGWRDLVYEESKSRVAMSQRSNYQPHGPDRTKAPWSKEQNNALDQWYLVSLHDDLDGLIQSPSDEDNDLDDDGWYDDGPTSCRDIIDTCDWHYYYSD